MKKSLLTLIIPLLVGTILVIFWHWLHHSLPLDKQFFLPSPRSVFEALYTQRGEFLQALWTTGMGAFLGLTAATVISILLALVLASSSLVRTGLYPYLLMLQMTPVIVFAPILILVIGPGLLSVVIITFLICFAPLVVNTTQGLLSVDTHLVDLFRLNRASRLDELLLLRLPAALPSAFTGLRIAATLAPLAAIVGDYTAGNSAGGTGGLGFLIIIHSSRFEIAELYATAFCGCLLGFLFVTIIALLSWASLHRWHDAYQQPNH